MSGCKPGERRGGRKKGVKNTRTAALSRALAKLRMEAAELKARSYGELLPLDFMLMIMRDETHPIELRLDAAKAAACYLHPKLSSAQHNIGPVEVRIRHFTDIDGNADQPAI